MHTDTGMSADRSAAERSQGAVQETAQALVASGKLCAAVKLLDRYLAEFDGDWGMWLYFAGLCARLGQRDEAVAAYRACARQLEGDGHFARAREALMAAVRLVPRDEALKREVALIGVPRKPAPPVIDPNATCLLMPVIEVKPAAPKWAPRLPDAAVHLTAVIPGRPKAPAVKPVPRLPDAAVHITAVIPGRREKPKRSRRPESSPELTDPHCPIFEFLDAERSGNPY